ncbi:MAG TPA: HAMP domain-containing sensor histidine kinase, partial [Elusimicrobiota bacterium]|nr:HAMP domain-containing sensor histidine kinase [Elusimicrobiota bacterium]
LLGRYMTHELRAPLTAVRTALGLLHMQLATTLDAEQRQVIAIATKNADRLNRLIDDIMDFSKLQAGKLRLSPEPVDPTALVNEAIESLRAWAVSKGVRVVNATEEPPARVWADPGRALQVLVNLLSNAIKFTPPGGKIEVSAVPGRHEHLGTIVFKVKDSGPGIPHGDLERVFAAFEQAAVEGKSAAGGTGTGLGLTLAKAMVELQGGRIWAESWKGLGASFLFTLPTVPSDTSRPVTVYPRKVEVHGLLAGAFRRLNAVVAVLFG